jgi:predicted ATPase
VIRQIEIKGLRGIREGVLSGLTPLVVLVGPNGSGKSTVLDAIMISGNTNPATAVSQMVARREGLNRGARWLLWKGGSQGPAVLKVTTDTGSVRTCELSVLAVADDRTTIHGVLNRGPTERGFTTHFGPGSGFEVREASESLPGVSEVRFIDPQFASLRTPLHHLYTKIYERGLIREAIAVVSDLVPGLEDIRILTEGELPLVYLIFRDHAVPAALAGDGIRLLLHLSFELLTRSDGLVLMEEPEAHMHPGAMRQCTRGTWAAVRRGVQVILTTHSLDLIDALQSEVSDKDLEKLSLYRLQPQDGVLKSSRLPGLDVAFARMEIHDDLR